MWETFEELELNILWPQVRRQCGVIVYLDKGGLLGCYPEGARLSIVSIRQSKNAIATVFQVADVGREENFRKNGINGSEPFYSKPKPREQ